MPKCNTIVLKRVNQIGYKIIFYILTLLFEKECIRVFEYLN